MPVFCLRHMSTVLGSLEEPFCALGTQVDISRNKFIIKSFNQEPFLIILRLGWYQD